MHVDLAGLGVHALDGVGDERNERAVLELQHGARGRVEDPRDGALELGHPTADEIRGEPLSLLELILHEQRLAAQRPRVAHSCEADKRPVVGAGLGLHEHGATLGQRMARTVHVEASVQAVGRPHPAGGYEGQSTTSTSTRCPSRTAVALITVRSAATVRPPRPITLPASSSATCSSSTIVPSSSSNDSTLTSSGRSTSDRARYSRSSSTYSAGASGSGSGVGSGSATAVAGAPFACTLTSCFTVLVGCAPRDTQCWKRSSSITIVEGSVCGL